MCYHALGPLAKITRDVAHMSVALRGCTGVSKLVERKAEFGGLDL